MHPLPESKSPQTKKDDFFDKALADRRPLEQALSDLRARHQRRPRPELAEMIRNVEAEISDREAAHKTKTRDGADDASSPVG